MRAQIINHNFIEALIQLDIMSRDDHRSGFYESSHHVMRRLLLMLKKMKILDMDHKFLGVNKFVYYKGKYPWFGESEHGF